jgi:histone acetyltransferase (RNA polymerase elongator complex component)
LNSKYYYSLRKMNHTDLNIFSERYANNYSQSDIDMVFDHELYDIRLTPDELAKLKTVFTNVPQTIGAGEYNKVIPKSITCSMTKTKVIEGYRQLVRNRQITRHPDLEVAMRMTSSRGDSGVVVITIFTSGEQFGDAKDIKRGGCPENCHYCPLERDNTTGQILQPRSYLSDEPGNKRATQNKHHPVGQTYARAASLEKQGHIPSFPTNDNTSNGGGGHSKVEIIISGGTFDFYPHDYIRWFVGCTYYALNTYYVYRDTRMPRPMLSLEEEQRLNETATLRMIGLTIETRPDRLFQTPTLPSDTNTSDSYQTVRFFRELGVTRVQIGVQHTDDRILDYVNRNCTQAQIHEGIRVLKANGFKTDIHIMYDLPIPSEIQDERPFDLSTWFWFYLLWLKTGLVLGLQWLTTFLRYFICYVSAISNTDGSLIRQRQKLIRQIRYLAELLAGWWQANMQPSTVFDSEHLAIVNRVSQITGKSIPERMRVAALCDLKMAKEIITNTNLQADQWKVYPTMITPFTRIQKWYEAGTYTPYANWENGLLLEWVIVYLKTLVPQYVRINRIIRDIPNQYILGGVDRPDMRNSIQGKMLQTGYDCQCIRCREPKTQKMSATDQQLRVQTYESSGGVEHFISITNRDDTRIYGMLRLRFPADHATTAAANPLTAYSHTMPQLVGQALIRELHVYGVHSGIGDMTTSGTQCQHRGLGRQLIAKALELSRAAGYPAVSVISGVGVRDYYRRQGFTDYHTYLRYEF